MRGVHPSTSLLQYIPVVVKVEICKTQFSYNKWTYVCTQKLQAVAHLDHLGPGKIYLKGPQNPQSKSRIILFGGPCTGLPRGLVLKIYFKALLDYEKQLKIKRFNTENLNNNCEEGDILFWPKILSC